MRRTINLPAGRYVAGTLIMTFCMLTLSAAGGFADEANAGNESGWIALFNGKDLNDWTIKFKDHPLGENYKNTFRVEDGVLKVSYDQWDEFNDIFGHIFYKEKFSKYKLRVEYRFVGEQVKGGAGWALRNNGVMLHCQEPRPWPGPAISRFH